MKQPESPLDPYVSLGLDLRQDGKNAVGECPLCGSNKFSVKVETGVCRCWSCNAGSAKGGMNARSFVAELWKVLDASTSNYSELAEARNLLPETVMEWGCCWNHMLGCWMVPGYNEAGQIRQLYRYVKTPEGRMALLGTKGLPAGLFGMSMYSKAKQEVHICEGAWDGMAWWEALGRTKYEAEEYKQTAGRNNLLADANVIAVPGVMTFQERWLRLLADKDVFLLFDNDHPRVNRKTGKEEKPPGLMGVQRLARMAMESKTPPSAVYYLGWGGPEVYHDATLQNGFDVRDAMKEWI